MPAPPGPPPSSPAVARRAFLPEADLPSTDRHADYIDAILSAWMRDPGHAAFRPFAIGERVPRPGDLLCADRSACR